MTTRMTGPPAGDPSREYHQSPAIPSAASTTAAKRPEKMSSFRGVDRGVGGGAIQADLGQDKQGSILSIIGLMTRARNAAFILLCVLLAASASAQSKGNARINGKILDDQGKPAQAGYW